ncbi:MAG: methyltransferase domain-containing protein [Planctomycetes bacterium]|nr:methyltransferase domain-containing protein [Planctomycetota bacterium]
MTHLTTSLRFSLLLAALSLPACSAPGGPHGESGHAHRRFDDPAAWSKRFDDPARDAWQRPGDVLALLGIERGWTVADLGAGTGYFLKHLSRAVGEEGTVLALDIEPSMVRHMSERVEREGLRNIRALVVPPEYRAPWRLEA